VGEKKRKKKEKKAKEVKEDEKGERKEKKEKRKKKEGPSSPGQEPSSGTMADVKVTVAVQPPVTKVPPAIDTQGVSFLHSSGLNSIA
jgi:hypothetical protein